MSLEIVNILCEVGEQFALFLKEMDKCVRRRKFVARREDIVGNRIENARILPEELDVEDLLRIAETEVF